MSTQFVVDEKGEKVAAVIPIAEYYELMEDLEDLADLAKRREEPTVPYEEVRKEMIANGLLQH
ncbi:MAG: hypothetical protein EOP87_22170 [Verrucomicrobiaceae bacterium]|nr:MAG: hypothetical protein EOP87_22170 [Verrucomicrobiaceae bacterium]